MTLLIVGIVVFLGVHLFTTQRPLRARVIGAIGEGGYKGAYSLLSVLGLLVIVMGWQAAPAVDLWYPPAFMRHLAYPLVWLAFVLIVAAYAPMGIIKARAKHPMLAAIKLWALGHLLVNGDLASLILFGSFLAYGVVNRIAVKRREAAEGAPDRSHARFGLGDVIALVGGSVAFWVFGVYLHQRLMGVVAIPM